MKRLLTLIILAALAAGCGTATQTHTVTVTKTKTVQRPLRQAEANLYLASAEQALADEHLLFTMGASSKANLRIVRNGAVMVRNLLRDSASGSAQAQITGMINDTARDVR